MITDIFMEIRHGQIVQAGVDFKHHMADSRGSIWNFVSVPCGRLSAGARRFQRTPVGERVRRVAGGDPGVQGRQLRVFYF